MRWQDCLSMRSNKKLISLACFLALCFVIEILGGLWTQTSVHTWYVGLKKASFNPPGWLFGPVWTVLYILIAISGWLVYCSSPRPERTRALWVYGWQLFFNCIWSFSFFYLQSPLLGFINIAILLLFILWTMILFRPLSRPASWILVPYLLWTAFAFILNTAIWSLN